MSELARRLIRENLASQNPYLDLGRCGLTDENFPEELGDCTHLETLVLANEWYAYHPEKRKWERKESSNPAGERSCSPSHLFFRTPIRPIRGWESPTLNETIIPTQTVHFVQSLQSCPFLLILSKSKRPKNTRKPSPQSC